MATHWSTDFLTNKSPGRNVALIILNQPFTVPLLNRAWAGSDWHCCADGGANRLHDALSDDLRDKFLPDLIKGDFDSLRDDVKEYYTLRGVPVVQDHDQNSTDLMKCVNALEAKESAESTRYDLLLLGGLAGRLDQTIHTLSYLHKLRQKREKTFAVTDDNAGWVLDAGEHYIDIDHATFGPTCGLLPVGIDSTILSMTGLRWNLTDTVSGFDGVVSTSNQLVPEEKTVWVKTTRPIWWTMELRLLTA